MAVKNVRELAITVVDDILWGEAYANLALNKALLTLDDANDRAFLTHLVYGVVRRKLPLDAALAKLMKKSIRAKDHLLESILLLGAFELLYTAAKPYAVVNEYVSATKRGGFVGREGFVNGVLRNVTRRKKELLEPVFEDPLRERAFRHSLPPWLLALWRRERGDEIASALVEAVDDVPQTVIRVNTLKTDRDDLMASLREAGVECHRGDLAIEAIYLGAGGVAAIPAELDGLYTVQGEASQLVADVVAAVAGERIWDMCAAPGGKTTHLAQRLENRGTIVATDLHPHRVELIRENAARLGINCIETQAGDAALLAASYPEAFDAILLDAPCSGLGVLARRLDSRLKKRFEDIADLVPIQRSLMAAAYEALRPGGRLIYSTCTLTLAENEENVAWLMERFPDMKPVAFDDRLVGLTAAEQAQAQSGQLTLYPYVHATDGFFIACLQKEKP